MQKIGWVSRLSATSDSFAARLDRAAPPKRGSAVMLQAAIIAAVLIPNTGAASPYWNAAIIVLGALVWLRLAVGGERIRPNGQVACVAIIFVAPLASLNVPSIDSLVGTLATAAFAVGLSLTAQATGVVAFGRVLWTTIALAAVEAALALVQINSDQFATWGFLGDQVRATVGLNELVPWFATGRAVGTMGHPIALGMLCAVGITLLASRALSARWPVRGALIGLLSVGIMASGTRSAAIAAVVGVAAALVFRPTRDRFSGGRAILVAIVSAAAAYALAMYAGIGASLSQSFSLTHRQGSIEGGLALFERPLYEVVFGSGPNGAVAAFSEGYISADGFLAIDNQIVWSFAVGGLVQVVALLVLLIRGVLRAVTVGSDVALTFVVMGVTFDFLGWNVPIILLIVLLQTPWLNQRRPRARDDRYPTRRRRRFSTA